MTGFASWCEAQGMGENHSTEGPLVSVVVPFYNVEDYAGPCLASLVAQIQIQASPTESRR